jgi:hypothetical protein
MTIQRVSRAIAVSLVGIYITGFTGGMPMSAKQPIPIIFDTDIGTDVDDAGTLAILHVLADRGEAKILATISSNQNRWAAPAIDVINTYYGRGDIPIGSSKTGPNDEYWYRDFVPKFPHDLTNGDDAPDAISLYRKILAEQPDHNVTIVVVGWLTNMAGLLNSSPDDYSPLSGLQLIAAKVKQLVIMGGTWPNIKNEKDYYFTAVKDGQCVSQKDGSNKWVPGSAQNHGYLVYKMPEEELATVIEDLMLTPPAR